VQRKRKISANPIKSDSAMKAMIFAAGLGTRLYPHTHATPKALIKIKNKPLIEIAIRRLIIFGYNEIIINVHHLADQIEEFVRNNNNFGISITFSDERAQLLDTGGGLKKASWFFDDKKPFLVHNVDVISTLDLTRLAEVHSNSKAMVTLAVRNRPSSRYLLFDNQNCLSGWENVKTGEKIIVNPTPVSYPMAFSGIQVIEPEIFKYMTLEGTFSIIDVYLKLTADHLIKAFEHNDSIWMDVGKPENLAMAAGIMDDIIN
jgi:NDP-sugar pyrophosphorylase family protein